MRLSAATAMKQCSFALAMSTLCQIACAPTPKRYRIGLPFTEGSLISVRFLQRNDAAVNSQIGFRTTVWHRVDRFPTAAEINNSEGRLDSLPLVLTPFTALYHEFNCFESPEKTTETTSTFADAQGFKKEN